VAVPPFPWLFPYVEDPGSAGRYGRGSPRQVLRPLLEVSLPGLEQKVPLLVDSGSEHTLLLKWVAQAADLQYEAAPKIALGLGGETVQVSRVTASLRLHPPGGGLDSYVEWETEVGVLERWKPTWSGLLGQAGFFDRWTVSMHRGARTVVVEDSPTYDQRYGVQIEQAEEIRRRSYP
jgi:hypothetical protein